MTTGEKNFIESKDTLIYNFLANLFLHGTLFVLCAADILLYIFNFEYKLMRSSLFGFVFAITIAIIDIINVFLRICVRKKYQHAYYGVCIIMISLYLDYFAIKGGLYPFNQLFGLLAVGIWVITSLVLIYAIIDNIKNDRYNDNSNSIYFFKKQKDDDSSKKRGIVITKYSLLIAFIYIVAAVGLLIVYFTSREAFEDGGKLLEDYSQIGLICVTFFLSYIINHGWKLVIRQIYVNKYIKE